jgi:hypothetical protein
VHSFTVSGEPHEQGIEGGQTVSSTITYTALEAPTVTAVKPAMGPVGGGTTVTITGTNFEDVTAVHFGALAGTGVKVKSATSLTVTAPASTAGKVDVTVTTGGGTSAVNTKDHFTFTPTITGVSPAEGSVAGGLKVTVTGTGFALGKTATTLKFGTRKGTSVECTSSTICTVTSPATTATGIVDVHATVNKATSPKTTADRFTYM